MTVCIGENVSFQWRYSIGQGLTRHSWEEIIGFRIAIILVKNFFHECARRRRRPPCFLTVAHRIAWPSGMCDRLTEFQRILSWFWEIFDRNIAFVYSSAREFVWRWLILSYRCVCFPFLIEIRHCWFAWREANFELQHTVETETIDYYNSNQSRDDLCSMGRFQHQLGQYLTEICSKLFKLIPFDPRFHSTFRW